MELSAKDFKAVADYIKQEQQHRAGKRSDLEKDWKEVDRQIAMTPLPKEVLSGAANDWYPDLEEPLQANALEVILADVRRLVFPSNSEWFTISAELSDRYLERFKQRRESNPLVGEGEGLILATQETANALTKAAMDYYHRLYDFRSRFDLFLGEGIKYGTMVGRTRNVLLTKNHHEFRGLPTKNQRGPSFIPSSIKNTYLDNMQAAISHEGVMVAPMHIRCGSQLFEDLKRAASIGGTERGWMSSQIRKLTPKGGRREKVEILEAEGDIIVPKTNGSIFLPNSIVTVAVGAGSAEVVRFQKNEGSDYIVDHYMREDMNSAYGTSPLLKGQPVQEAASFALNDLMAAGALNARPPVSFDGNDARFSALGGPELAPGAMWATDSPEKVKVHQIGDVAALLNVYVALIKKYEDLTGVNDPRRGAQVRSHTTTGAHAIEADKGQARTVDFAVAIGEGSLTTILYHEFSLIKEALKKPTAIPVDSAGIEGWVNIAAPDLPDRVMIKVTGASGPAEKQRRAQEFIAATNMALQIVQLAEQRGERIDVDFVEIIAENYENVGVQNPTRFIRRAAAVSGPAQGGPPVPGAGAPDTTNALEALQSLAG